MRLRTAASRNNDGDNNNSSSNDFYRLLTDRLGRLSFQSFRTLVILWLGAKGYRDICVLPRTASRGRRAQSGADFIASSPQVRFVQVAVAIRFWRTPLQARTVDELRGYLLRRGIPTGMIVCRGRISVKARQRSLQYPGRPIRLVSIHQLAGSLAARGLGLRRIDQRWMIDERFFRTLPSVTFARSVKFGIGYSRSNSAGSTDFHPVLLRLLRCREWLWRHHWIPLASVIAIVLYLLGACR